MIHIFQEDQLDRDRDSAVETREVRVVPEEAVLPVPDPDPGMIGSLFKEEIVFIRCFFLLS